MATWEQAESSHFKHFDPYEDLNVCSCCDNYAQEDKETCLSCEEE